MKQLFFVVLFSFLSITVLWAQEEEMGNIVPDRPDQSESTVSQYKKTLQVESGIEFGQSKDDFFKFQYGSMPN